MTRTWTLACLAALCGLAPACNQKTPATEAAPPSEASQPLVEDSPPQVIETADGRIEVVPLQHASLVLRWGELAIHVDPVADAYGASAASPPAADLVLLTDIHGDHLDPAQVAAVRKEGAPVIAPEAAATDIPEATVLDNGEDTTVLGDIRVRAVPMYNLERTRPDTGELYHVPGRGNGYLVTRGETTVYIAGDTECIPEMKALTGIDVAFVPMNLPYTMPVDEAAACVREFRPSVVFPYHHRGQDPTAFAAALADVPEVDVRVLDWYPQSDAITGEK